MARNLDKLNQDELYLFLAGKVGQEAATAIKSEGVSGGTLIHLTDKELKDLLPKLGPRRMVKRLVDDFHSSGPSENKVYTNHHDHHSASCNVHLFVYLICWMWKMSYL